MAADCSGGANSVSARTDRGGGRVPASGDGAGLEDVWLRRRGGLGRWGAGHVGAFLLLSTAIAVMDLLGGVTVPGPHGGVHFWPSAAFQVVGAIWFGIWGVLASVAGPMAANLFITGSPWSLLAANLIRGLGCAWLVRRLGADPRLGHGRDWKVIGGGCCVGVNAVAAAAATIEVALESRLGLRWHAEGSYGLLLGQFALGTALPSLVFVPALLGALSPSMLRTGAFCHSLLGSRARARDGRGAPRFRDWPILTKLLALVFAAGFLPLLGLSVWSFAETVRLGNVLAGSASENVSRYVRQALEQRELMLRTTAARLRAARSASVRDEILMRAVLEGEVFNGLQVRETTVAELHERGQEWLLRGTRPPVQISLMGDPQGQWGALMEQLQMTLVLSRRDEEAALLVAQLRMPGLEGERLGLWRGQVAGWMILGGDRRQRLNCGLPPGIENSFPPLSLDSWRTRFEGRTWHCSSERMPDGRGYLVVASRARTALWEILGYGTNWKSIFSSLAIVLSAVLGGYLARSMSGRVRSMAGEVQEALSEPTSLHVAAEGGDEIGVLGRAINELSGELRDYVERLRTTTAHVERMASEMEIARQLQSGVLPRRPPALRGYDVAGVSVPARQVGGDVYDWWRLADGRCGLLLGDASGKGIGAAMLMHEARGITRAFALEGYGASRTMQKANYTLCNLQEEFAGNFVTMLYCILDPDTGRMQMATAGHMPPVWSAWDEAAAEMEVGLPLGIVPANRIVEAERSLEKGGWVALYSDGVTEALNAEGEPFGLARFEAVLAEAAPLGAAEAVTRVVRSVKEFTAGREQTDDITMLLVRRLP
jgi:serine phosphatase RsbU (regulator of sigma subunit)